MEIAKDATSRHLISTSYFASGGFCTNKPATTLECRIFMDRFQKYICDFRSELGCSSNLLISSREMKMITLSFIKIQNPPVSLSSASPLGFIAQAWWMWLPQEHLTPQAIQRFKHATQLQLVTFSISTFGSKRIGFPQILFLSLSLPGAIKSVHFRRCHIGPWQQHATALSQFQFWSQPHPTMQGGWTILEP